MSLKQILKNEWLYSWVLIVPLAIIASFTDLLLLGGIRLFLSIITNLNSSIFNFNIEILNNISIAEWIILMFSIIAVRYLSITLRARSEVRFTHQLESNLRVWWVRIVKKIHPSMFYKREFDSILHDSNASISELSKGYKVITQSVQAISQLLFFVPVLFLISWKLALILFFIFAPIVWYLQKSLKKAEQKASDYNLSSGDYDSNLWRWSALRKFWNNKAELSKYLSVIFDKIRNLKKISTKLSVRDATIVQNIETFSILIMCIVLAICANLIQNNTMESFQIILFCAALFICYKPLKDCSNLFTGLRELKKAHERLSCLENMERSVYFIKNTEDECIKIENMSFKYGDDTPWIFENLDKEINLSRPLILQGNNGKGKTTLLRILSHLEIPQKGNIFMPKQTAYSSFYFSQRLFLPPTSWLAEEVEKREWNPTITKFFEVLDLENLLKKPGHSNGELQRIGLAWAIVSDAPFLFLDEPFASVAEDLRESIFRAFWNATTETKQWWMMASHYIPPEVYRERVFYWKL